MADVSDFACGWSCGCLPGIAGRYFLLRGFGLQHWQHKSSRDVQSPAWVGTVTPFAAG
jgi:hypothetical protein